MCADELVVLPLIEGECDGELEDIGGRPRHAAPDVEVNTGEVLEKEYSEGESIAVSTTETITEGENETCGCVVPIRDIGIAGRGGEVRPADSGESCLYDDGVGIEV